jgi:hypothetical protein
MRTDRSDGRLMVEATTVAAPALVRSGTYRSLAAPLDRAPAGGLGAACASDPGAASVAIILVVRAETGSLALAGAIVSAVWIAGGIARPLQGRVIDRGGAKRLLALCGIAHAAALAGIVGIARLQGLGWLLIVLVLAGLALPPISTSMRTEWRCSCPRTSAREGVENSELPQLSRARLRPWVVPLSRRRGWCCRRARR